MSEQNAANPLLALSTHLVQLVESAAPAVVGIRSHGRRVASGFVWRPGVVVTASDALEADDDVAVSGADGKVLRAEFAGRDPTTDIAVLRAGDGLPAPLAMSIAEPPRMGQLVVAVGQGKDGVTAALGMVSVAGGPWQSQRGGSIDRLIRLDMRLDGRSEGGLVVDAEGRSIGMAVFGPRQRPLVIPRATIERVGAKLLADGRIVRGYLGVGLHPVRLDDSLVRTHALPERHGIMVVSLDPAGPARGAGVLVGDIIVGMDGEAIAGARGLFARLTSESVGKSAELKMIRAGEVATTKVTIGSTPA